MSFLKKRKKYYEIILISIGKNMKLHTYSSYKKYVQSQVKANKKKIKRVWASKKEIDKICEYILKNQKKVLFGICHGARNGWEVYRFRKKLNANIIGTDISETALNFKHMIQWDFHIIKKEWQKNVDFIYSNALDHSYNPSFCLDQWMKCLNNNGFCFLHWSPSCDGNVDSVDAFKADIIEYKRMISKKYLIVDELEVKCIGYRMTLDKRKEENRIIFVISNR